MPVPTPEQIEQHYRLEKALAARILAAPREERDRVTMAAYDELFRLVTWHPGRLEDAEVRRRNELSYRAFFRFAGAGREVLEIGCGVGDRVRALAARSRRAVGIDISARILDLRAPLPPNAELHVASAADLRIFADASFDLAFSKQLLEHVHPEEVPDHLREVCRVLRPGGSYVFETPNRISGPHDVSRYFDAVATGFHLREYSIGDLRPLLRAAGFRSCRSPMFRDRAYEVSPLLGRLTELPCAWYAPAEALAAALPRRWRRRAVSLLRLNAFIIARR